MECYTKVVKPFASSYPNHCFVWLFNYLSLSRISSLAWCLILIFSICFCVAKMILDLCVNYHREINPNTSCSWTIGTLSCGTYILIIFTLPIAFNCLISSQKCICLNSHCLPWLLLFHLILLNLFCVISM
jgi:hypothetical protein